MVPLQDTKATLQLVMDNLAKCTSLPSALEVRVAIQDAIDSVEKQQLKVTSEAAFNQWLYDYTYKTLDKCYVVEMQKDN